MRRAALLALVVTLAWPGRAGADVPADQQALVVLRILAYDHNLVSRSGKQIELAVIHETGDESSATAATKVEAAFARLAGKVTVAGLPVHVVALATGEHLADDLRRHGVNAIYLCRGLDAEVLAIAKLARGRAALTFTDVASYLDDGAAIALDQRGKKIQIDVNLVAAKAAGAQLGAQLLRLAKVVKR